MIEENLEAAIEWLEDENRMRRNRQLRHTRSHQRPIFQIMTDHEYAVDHSIQGMTELEIVTDVWGGTAGLDDMCGICGSNPIILGTDSIDSV